MGSPSINSLTEHCLLKARTLAVEVERIDTQFGCGLDAKFSDQACRFAVWAGNIGAHETGNSSLEFRLRDASHIKNGVIGLLSDLQELLDDGLAICKGEVTPWDQLPEDESEEEEAFSNDGDTSTEMEQIASHEKDLIDCLFRMSITIKNPAPHDFFFASSSSNANYYEGYDVRHVQSLFPDIEPWLAERLGRSNTRRREYFKYRKAHHERLAHGLEGEEKDAVSTVASSITERSNQGGMNVFLEGDDQSDDDRVSSTTNATTSSGSDQISIPQRPRRADTGQFECPLCYMIITARDKDSWKRHVFGDLRPYVCLEENCVDAGQEFERQHGWLTHMKDAHWKIYNCPSGCGMGFHSRIKCEEHIDSMHPGTIPSPNLKAEINLHAIDVEDDSVLTCRLCGQAQNCIARFRRHVGRHLEQLSLFTLPPLEADDGDQSDHDISQDPNISEQGDGDGGNLETDISHQDVPSSSAPEFRVLSSLQEHDDASTNITFPSGDAMMAQAEDTHDDHSGLMSTERIESGTPNEKGREYCWTCHNCGFGELNYHLTPSCVSCTHYCCNECTVRVLIV